MGGREGRGWETGRERGTERAQQTETRKAKGEGGSEGWQPAAEQAMLRESATKAADSVPRQRLRERSHSVRWDGGLSSVTR